MLQKVKLQVLSVLVAAFAIALFPAALLGTASTADAQSPRVETMSKSVKSMIRSLRANARLLNKKISKLQRKRLRKGTRPSARELRLVRRLSHTLEQMALVSGQLPTGDRLALSVTSGLRFFLIDAVRDEVVRELFGEVELREDDARRVNIIAVLPEGMQAGSVIFSRDANPEVARENVAPYALFGDNSRGDYQEGTFALGTHTVGARAYSGRNGGGNVLLEGEVTISVTPEQEPEQVELTLVDTGTGQSIASVTDGMRIDLAQHSGINILASSPLSAVRSVRFTYGGESRVESYAPYALAGDGGEGVYYPWDAPLGSVSLKVELFSERNAGGSLLASRIVALSIVRTVVPTATPTPTPSVPPTPPATRTPTPTPTPSPSATPPPPTMTPTPPPPAAGDYDPAYVSLPWANADKVFYVSSSQGNDTNDGLSAARPLRTLAKGMTKLRSGSADWLLLKRGDTFGESFGGHNTRRGHSPSRPMIISAYGSGPRPIIQTESAGLSFTDESTTEQHLWIVGLHFKHLGTTNSAGIRFVSSMQDILIEDNIIDGFGENIIIQDSTSNSDNVRIRNNVLLNSRIYSHSQGIFARGIDNLLLEGNVCDNGWTDSERELKADNQAGIYAHCFYIQRTAELDHIEVRDNIIARGASHGAQLRNGGIAENNLFVMNPIGLLVGNEGVYASEKPVTAIVQNNAFVHARDIHSGLKRGYGIELQNCRDCLVRNNLIAHQEGASRSSGRGITIIDEHSDMKATSQLVHISENVIYDVNNAIGLRAKNNSARLIENGIVERNRIYSTFSSDRLVNHRRSSTLPRVQYFENDYFRAGAPGDWFEVQGAFLSLGQWRSTANSLGETSLNVNLPHPERDLDSYARSIGLGNRWEFLEAIRTQSATNYDPRLSARAVVRYLKTGFSTP